MKVTVRANGGGPSVSGLYLPCSEITSAYLDMQLQEKAITSIVALLKVDQGGREP